MNEDGHWCDGIKENVQTEVPVRLLQSDSARISCVIRMHVMNLEVFLVPRAGGVP